MHVLLYQLTLDFTGVSMNFLSTIVYMQSVYLSYSGKIGAELGKLFIDNWTNVLLEFINLKKINNRISTDSNHWLSRKILRKFLYK